MASASEEMTVIYIIGGAGFVGQAYPRLLAAKGLPYTLVTRENYASLIGTSCDILINANGNSKKFMSDHDPVWDFDASVVSVVRSLADFNAGTYVLLSSGDVYPTQDSPEVTREDQAIDLRRTSRYGLHKYMAETVVRATHPRPLVMRMGGFVGPGMKKNAIFDMLNDQPIWLHPESELQFISTDRAASLVWSLVEQGVTHETVNLGAHGVVRIADLYARIKPKSEFQPTARKVRFEISTDKLAALSGEALPRTTDEIDAFLIAQGY